MSNGEQYHKRDPFTLNLLENGIDFIRSGIEHFFINEAVEPRSYKYAILHLFAGVLLVLKERLRREHPSLVFERVHDVGDDKARTVDFDLLLHRLKCIAHVTLSSSDENRLRKTQVLRNQLEHYEVALNLHHAEAIIGELCTLVVLFLRDELSINLEEHLSSEAWERVQELREIAKRLRQEYIEQWRDRTQHYRELTDVELSNLADIEPYHPKHNPDPDILYNCEECWKTSVRIVDDESVGEIAVCTNPTCRQVYEVNRCLRCEEPLFDSEGFCEACNSWIDEQ